MRQNLDLFDFRLSDEDMAAIRKLVTGKVFILGSHDDPKFNVYF